MKAVSLAYWLWLDRRSPKVLYSLHQLFERNWLGILAYWFVMGGHAKSLVHIVPYSAVLVCLRLYCVCN